MTRRRASAPAGGLHPIRAAARLTRLSPDTLRAWERRHSAVQPRRVNGVRMYTAEDIDRLTQLREAVEAGHSIGHAVSLQDDHLRELAQPGISTVRPARKTSALEERSETDVVLAAVERFDYAAADRELGRLAALHSSRDLVYAIALPLLREAGERWHRKRFRIAQEHMLTRLLGNLAGGLCRLRQMETPVAKLIAGTLSGDRHEFGVLAASLLAASAGLSVTHLGPDLPAREIAYAARHSGAAIVLVSVTAPEDVAEVRKQIQDLRRGLGARVELWVGLNPAQLESDLQLAGVRCLKDFTDLERELRRRGGTL